MVQGIICACVHLWTLFGYSLVPRPLLDLISYPWIFHRDSEMKPGSGLGIRLVWLLTLYGMYYVVVSILCTSFYWNFWWTIFTMYCNPPKISPPSKIRPSPFPFMNEVVAKGALLSKVRPPNCAAEHAVMLSKKQRRSSTNKEEGLTNEGRHH